MKSTGTQAIDGQMSVHPSAPRPAARPRVGCIGHCAVCGKAIVLRATYIDGSQFWAHFGVGPDHYAVPSTGARDVRPG